MTAEPVVPTPTTAPPVAPVAPPKLRGSVPPHWLFEVRFACIDGHVFLTIHPQGKPQFPVQNGVVTNGAACARELLTTLEQAETWSSPRG